MPAVDHRIRVWDLPTRLFHGLLAAGVGGAVLTAKVGGNAMVWHGRIGHAMLALLAFRLVWRLVGTRYARFAFAATFSSKGTRPSTIAPIRPKWVPIRFITDCR